METRRMDPSRSSDDSPDPLLNHNYPPLELHIPQQNLILIGWLPSTLRILNVSNNCLNDISIVARQCPNLEILNISHNFLSYNQISAKQELRALSFCTSLQTLYFHHNPLHHTYYNESTIKQMMVRGKSEVQRGMESGVINELLKFRNVLQTIRSFSKSLQTFDGEDVAILVTALGPLIHIKSASNPIQESKDLESKTEVRIRDSIPNTFSSIDLDGIDQRQPPNTLRTSSATQRSIRTSRKSARQLITEKEEPKHCLVSGFHPAIFFLNTTHPHISTKRYRTIERDSMEILSTLQLSQPIHLSPTRPSLPLSLPTSQPSDRHDIPQQQPEWSSQDITSTFRSTEIGTWRHQNTEQPEIDEFDEKEQRRLFINASLLVMRLILSTLTDKWTDLKQKVKKGTKIAAFLQNERIKEHETDKIKQDDKLQEWVIKKEIEKERRRRQRERDQRGVELGRERRDWIRVIKTVEKTMDIKPKSKQSSLPAIRAQEQSELADVNRSPTKTTPVKGDEEENEDLFHSQLRTPLRDDTLNFSLSSTGMSGRGWNEDIDDFGEEFGETRHTKQNADNDGRNETLKSFTSPLRTPNRWTTNERSPRYTTTRRSPRQGSAPQKKENEQEMTLNETLRVREERSTLLMEQALSFVQSYVPTLSASLDPVQFVSSSPRSRRAQHQSLFHTSLSVSSFFTFISHSLPPPLSSSYALTSSITSNNDTTYLQTLRSSETRRHHNTSSYVSAFSSLMPGAGSAATQMVARSDTLRLGATEVKRRETDRRPDKTLPAKGALGRREEEIVGDLVFSLMTDTALLDVCWATLREEDRMSDETDEHANTFRSEFVADDADQSPPISLHELAESFESILSSLKEAWLWTSYFSVQLWLTTKSIESDTAALKKMRKHRLEAKQGERLHTKQKREVGLRDSERTTRNESNRPPIWEVEMPRSPTVYDSTTHFLSPTKSMDLAQQQRIEREKEALAKEKFKKMGLNDLNETKLSDPPHYLSPTRSSQQKNREEKEHRERFQQEKIRTQKLDLRASSREKTK
ncbi:hypothetical protein BLNAU_4610 [Blattamonas nauphoetae]|uniref:Uncharacterized protein n=1 Tax=Blattamonas nauphoetae TaxID=2049346 RepID=A0ABQ9Y9G2_9EUKA|nr:hypothetical protein BLNAU_4610 [Blattamonas nauphoetae]